MHWCKKNLDGFKREKMKILFLIVFGFVFFIFGVRYMERHSLYFPMKEILTKPDMIGIAYEDVYFETNDGLKLNGWFVPVEDGYYTILFSHGNAGNISHRMEKLLMLHNLNLNVFIYDYRGYGKSEGRPSETGLYKDIMAAYRYLTERRGIPPDRIILYGESLGGAVAIELALRKDVRALITEGTFTSIKDMAEMVFPFVPYSVFSPKFDSLSKIQKIDCQKLIMHSIEDEIVPFSFGERIYKYAREPKEFCMLKGSHNTAFLDSQEGYKNTIRAFIKSL